MRMWSRFGVLVILWTITANASGQTPLQETVTVTASTYPVPFEDLSRTVMVLTAEQIARLPVRSIPELLQYSSSVDVRSRGPFGMQSDFSIRGAGFGQTLVLIDGQRMNDAQTGHHNADIPVLLEDVERVEILYGPGSSLYGADAFGGTINIITKKKQTGFGASVAGGEHGWAEGSLHGGMEKGKLRQSLGVVVNRSDGFTFDREFHSLGFSSYTQLGERSRISISHLDKAFGANGFYGPSPSKEWTNSTLLAFDQHWLTSPTWDLSTQASYRTHGDHFLYDVRRPGFFENRHRTHALGIQARLRHTVSESTHWTIGGDLGEDWITSNNLGDHSFDRGSVMAELQRKLGAKAVLSPSIRFDSYSGFGRAVSPSLSGSWWVLPKVKLRSSVGHAFRIPTFTELYYTDPNNQASATLKPEQAWGGETGADWLFHSSWMATLSLFIRDERDVIDWVRETPQQKWRTTNLRKVRSDGMEIGLQHLLPTGRVEFQYTLIDSDAGDIPYLSKYILDYARHSVSGFASLNLPRQFSVGPRISFKRRNDGRQYWVLDSRVARSFGRMVFYVEGSNLTDSHYQEITGVDMPGRWLRTGLEWRQF